MNARIGWETAVPCTASVGYNDPVNVLAELVDGVEPAFDKAGRRLYGKMPIGALAYYHYYFPPAEEGHLARHRWAGRRLADYLALLDYSNGYLLFDKRLSIFGIGDLMSRSLQPTELVADSFERENTSYFWGSETSTDPIVGLFDLSIRYYIVLTKDGGCQIRGEDGIISSFDNLVSTLEFVAHCFYDNLTFGLPVNDESTARVERCVREIG